MGTRGVGNLKFTIYIPLVPKTHHIKFEKNWFTCEETLRIMFGPALGGKTSTPRIMKFTISVEVFLLYIALKFTIYVPLVPKIHHIKFEKNWSSGYQEEVKNVQMCIDTTHHVWPHPGPRIMKFKILVEIFLLKNV
jgi:hypothetical protein